MTNNCVNKPCEKGISLIFTAMTLVFVVPLIGLAVDGGILYTVKAKLQTAVDAAALAGARTLSRGNDGQTQANNAISVAEEYALLNFPNGYFNIAAPVFNSSDVTADTTSVNHQRTVSVTARVTVPLYFLRYLGNTSTTVAATATAVRRDVNVVIIMDRSGSLAASGSCAPLQQAAIGFVNKFSNGTDNVGLVTFASSSMNDFPAANNFQTATPSVNTILGELVCDGATNTSQGLYQGYQQLVALNQPTALNVILFFTDGYPTAFTAQFPIKSASTCTSKTAKTAALSENGSSPWGLLNPVASVQPMSSDLNLGPTGNTAGCAYAASWSTNATKIANDIQNIPASDVYGNAMNTNYQSVTYTDGTHTTMTVDWLTIQNASINGADSQGFTSRQSTTIPGIHVFSVGLGNSGGVPADFMERVANDPRASNFDTTYPVGQYIYAPTSAELTDAFATIASEILHLSK